MTSSAPKFGFNLFEPKSQIPLQRSKVLPIHSYSRKNATPKGAETSPFAKTVRGSSSEMRISQTSRRTLSEHRYKKLLYTMADQQDSKISESTALMTMTLGDYTGFSAKRIETSPPQMLRPTSGSQPLSTRRNIPNLRKSNFSVSESKVFGNSRFNPTSILTDRSQNFKLDLLSTLTKKSMKKLQKNDGGGDTLLLGSSPKKPVKKISVGGEGKQDNYLSTRLTIHDCPILSSDYRYQAIENIIKDYLEKLQIPFSVYSVFQNIQSQDYSIIFPANFPLACSKCSSSSSFLLSQKNGLSIRCIVNTCNNLTVTSQNAPLHLPPKIAAHLWGIPAETAVYGLDTEGSLEEWDHSAKSPTHGLPSTRETPKKIFTSSYKKFSVGKDEYRIEYRSYKERFKGDLEAYLAKARTAHDNHQRKVYKAYNGKGGSRTQRVNAAASPTNTLLAQKKETLMTEDNNTSLQSLNDLNFNLGQEDKINRDIQGFIAEYFLRQKEEEEEKKRKKPIIRERLYTKLEKNKKKTRGELSTFKSFAITQSEIESSFGEMALKSVFPSENKKW